LFALTRPELGIGGVVNWMGAVGPWFGLMLSAVWMTGYANAFNFMDGINGLAAGQAATTGAGMALLGGLALGDFGATPVLVSCVIAGAAAGFLPHNFPRARMFMGDVGSVTLGFLLASVALWLVKAGGRELIVPLALLHANFILDTGITLVRRILRGQPFDQAHREHFYQRLVRSGKSHVFVTTLQMVLQALVIVLLVVFVRSGVTLKWYIAATVIAIWLAFFCYAEACFRRSQQANVQ
jgi:UDP-N-acetylmuramyl pentapeptide phosphotransferase/UDP-N-acetylglucosamine-1-phosphate transferase